MEHDENNKTQTQPENQDEIAKITASKLMKKAISLLILSVIGFIVAVTCVYFINVEIMHTYDDVSIINFFSATILIPHVIGTIIFVVEILLTKSVISTFLNPKIKLIKGIYIALILTIISAMGILYAILMYLSLF